mmetsp:Transcript_666/g.1062  ORF Transcript_666/g.1062 Transcript_666/m.1062 type:complete len:203 (-) Transcript_666:724-1332(-)
MTSQIKVTTCRNTHQLLLTKRKLKGNIRTSPSIMSQSIPLMNIIPHQILSQSHSFQKCLGIRNPLLMEWLPNIITRRDEIFNLHLFKFPTTKDEVTRSNFITECLANLSNSKWQLLTTGSNNVFVIDENSLRSFGTEVGYRGSILHRTNIGLEHEIKVTGHGKSGLAATRRWNLTHFLLRYLCKVFECKGLNRLSLPITFFK